MTTDFMQSSTSTAQGHWKCSICGQSVPYGELHLCGERADLGPAAGVWGLAEEPLSPRTYPSLSGTGTAGYWICPHCGARIPGGVPHICGGKGESNKATWPSYFPPNGSRPKQFPYADNVTSPPNSDLAERRVRALERIADALETLARGNG